jgi:hypothetical protein
VGSQIIPTYNNALPALSSKLHEVPLSFSYRFCDEYGITVGSENESASRGRSAFERYTMEKLW